MRCPHVVLLITSVVFSLSIGLGSASAQCPGEGSCLQANGTPGCDNQECCKNVCLLVPSCCQVEWDAFCADTADSFCPGLCGSAAAGGCFGPNQTSGCNDPACCAQVCPIDPFCCETKWDASCAALASQLCESAGPGTCGDPAAGSCFVSNGTPACNNQSCCQAVCALVPSCCTTVWDFLCVSIANNVCTQTCTVPCPNGSVVEAETCGQRTNDPCFVTTNGTPQPIACGNTVCGTIQDLSHQGGAPDVDVFRLTVSGQGKQRLVISFRSAFIGFLAVTPAQCGNLADAVGFTDGSDCIPRVIEVCVDPGDWWIVVASGTFPTPGVGNIFCLTGDTYRFTVSCSGSCAPVCGSAEGSCFVPHGTPGCEDVDCCDAVCMVDPSCCSASWDAVCAQEAIELCNGTKPANDSCDNCTPVGPGVHPFTNIGATPTDLPLPSSCDEGFGLSFGQDVWFCYEAVCDGPTVIETCGNATFDTRLAIYTMGCDRLEFVACNDDSILCIVPERSRILLNAVCGTTYFIRLGGFADEIGVGELNIDCDLSPECPDKCIGDFDGNGVVDGADLGFLLQSWGLTGPADLNGDGIVDGGDLGILLNEWGPCR